MAAISEIRRKNLLRLRKTAKNDYNTASNGVRYTNIMFCQFIGINTTIFSQLTSSPQKLNFNENYARKIEQKVMLDNGWLDIDRDSTNVNDLKIPYKSFRKGVLSYCDFINSGSIAITDDDKREHLLQNLFLYLNTQNDISKVELNEADFFDLLK